MNQEIFQDLLLLQESGMASPATQQWIAGLRESHPEWVAVPSAPLDLPSLAAPGRLERESLARTQKLLSRRSWLMGLGYFLSLSPLSFVFEGREITFLLYRDQPAIAMALGCLALVVWAVFLWTCRRLTAAGLQPAGGAKSLLMWMLGAILAAGPIFLLLTMRSGFREPLGSFMAAGFIGICCGVSTGRVKKPE